MDDNDNENNVCEKNNKRRRKVDHLKQETTSTTAAAETAVANDNDDNSNTSSSRCSVPDNSRCISFRLCSIVLYTSIITQCLLSPFTKVEESFNASGATNL